MPSKSKIEMTEGNDGMQLQRCSDRPPTQDAVPLSHLRKMAPANIEFSNLTYTIPYSGKGPKAILKGISGQFRSGELSAILGPSGAGKSTLLNILAGYRSTDVTGHVSVNGRTECIDRLRKLSCYIMQEDLLQPRLTVFEAMQFTMDLKLGNVSGETKLAAIEEILEVLRLKRARNTVTENLSGGERKRLSIALELTNNPPVIFLDEPTTGLDEISALQCVDMLKQVAQLGRTVICSLHTPSATMFSRFDHIYVIAEGQCVYRSTVDDLVPFLQQVGIECPKHYNPADFMIEVSAGEYGTEWIGRLMSFVDTELPIVPISPWSKEKEQFAKETISVPWLDQFVILSKRMLLQLYRNRSYVYMKLSIHVFLGLVIGALFQNVGNDGTKSLFNFGFCFASLMIFLYVPMLPTLMQFPAEVQLVKREYFNMWYNLSPYYCAFTVVSIPTRIMESTIYLSIAYLITGQPLELFRCSLFFSICIMCMFIAESMALAVASTLSTIGLGETKPLPIYRSLTMYVSYIRYGLEGLVTSLYGYNRGKLYCPPSEYFCYFAVPQQLLLIMRMEHVQMWINIFALLVVLLAMKILTFYLLRQRLTPNKTFQALRLAGRLIKGHLNINT
ncbi:ATP-binding cassette sub-family G member 1 isoform X2 [Nomia melanderi]|uniref:ATP-binding cassette sub-family G member 1 isoform X2 n=1 Tax=Nomia melanderi TaxID=2448451 RepID=UPI003FCEA8F6